MVLERSWYLAKEVKQSIKKEDVKAVVKRYERCLSINLAPTSHKPGELSVDDKYSGLAVDVAY